MNVVLIMVRVGILIILALMLNTALGYENKVDSLILLAITIFCLKSMNIGRWVFVFIVLVSALYIPVSLNYGHPNLTIISALSETNVSEAIEFAKDTDWLAILIAILFTGSTLFLFHFVPKVSSKKLNIFLVVVFSFLLFDKPIRTMIDRKVCDDYVYKTISYMRYAPARFIFDWYDSYDKYHEYNKQIRSQREVASTWIITKENDVPQNTILVIGESVRKDYMNAYGFEANNTPFMSHSVGQLWLDFLSAGPNTFTSVMRFITLGDGINIELNNNINTLASTTGIETYWISNQGRMGEFDTGISMIASYADNLSFTRSGSFRDSNVYDSALLPEVRSALSENQNSKLIVVHLIGSHPGFCDRVEGDVDFSFNGSKISCYIQSIKQTDSLLSNINDYAKQQPIDYNLIYLSDHGLGHREGGKNLRHDPLVKQAYEVPLFITGSNFDERHIMTPRRNGFSVLKGISEVMGISTVKLDKMNSFFSEVDDKAIVNNGEGEIVDFQSLNEDPIK